MTHVLYHDHCADGFASAFIAWLHLSTLPDADSTRYIPVSYPRVIPPAIAATIADGDTVYILDWSLPRADLIALGQRLDQLVVIDHHATAFADLQDLPNVIFDETKAACQLTWEFFHGRGIAPDWLEHIAARDLGHLWDPEAPFSESEREQIELVYAGLWLGTERDFMAWLAVGFHTLLTRGRAILTAQRIQVQQIASQAHWLAIGPHIVPAVTTASMQSEVCHELLQHYPEAPFAVAWFVTPQQGGTIGWQYSLRSRKAPDPLAFDVATIALAHGGGGHPQAAGFTIASPYQPCATEVGARHLAHRHTQNTPNGYTALIIPG